MQTRRYASSFVLQSFNINYCYLGYATDYAGARMEQQLLQLLTDSQSAANDTRSGAENQLLSLYGDQGYPLSLLSVASNDHVSLPDRQAALLALKNLVLAGWSDEFDEYKGSLLFNDQTKAIARDAVLALAVGDGVERKIQNAAAYVVSKIASADYPHDWSGLVPLLLHLVPEASDSSLRGILRILSELVEDGLNDDQFFNVAQNLVAALHYTATAERRPLVARAMAVSVLHACFETLETMMEVHKAAVHTFAENALASWMPFFLAVLNTRVGFKDVNRNLTQGADLWQGLVTLKIQVVKVL